MRSNENAFSFYLDWKRTFKICNTFDIDYLNEVDPDDYFIYNYVLMNDESKYYINDLLDIFVDHFSLFFHNVNSKFS